MSWSALKIAYKTVPILLIVWMVFVLHAWKWRIFRNWLVPFPCLDGTWQGHLQTTWENPDTRKSSRPDFGASDDTADVWSNQLRDAHG